MRKTFWIISVILLVVDVMAEVVFEEDFNAIGSHQGGIYYMTLGGDTNNQDVVEFGQFGRTAQGSVTNIGGSHGNVIRVSDNGNYTRLVGFYIDPADFGGAAGTYTLEFDVLNGTDQNNAYVWIYKGSGYNLATNSTDTLTLDLAAANNNDLTGLTASGGATASQIATKSFWEYGNKTISLDFEYDGSSTVAVAIGGWGRDFMVDNFAVTGAAGIVFEENFDPEGLYEGGIYYMTLGGDTNEAAVVDFGQFGITPQGKRITYYVEDIGLGEKVQVNDDGTYTRLVGFFVDPADFGGIAGTCTLHFDVMGGSDNTDAYAWVYAGSGYSLASNSTDTLTLDLAASYPAQLEGLTASGNAMASQIAVTNFVEVSDRAISLDFEYDGSSAIAVAIGGYAKDFQIDNVVIETAASAINPPASFMGIERAIGGKIKLTIGTAGDLSAYTLMGCTNLVDGNWLAVAHSDDGENPFVETNLTYSTAEGSNAVIYVESSKDNEFFSLQY